MSTTTYVIMEKQDKYYVDNPLCWSYAYDSTPLKLYSPIIALGLIFSKSFMYALANPL